MIWVGLPSQRSSKPSEDSSYLNELYRSRAEKAGIIYVDIWDGFVDEAGHYSAQGPDYEGQIRRLRTGDGVYFTKFGARKLAHYVEREVQRIIGNKSLPVALPIPVDPGPAKAKQSAPAQRPEAGPVVPLTVTRVAPEELLGGGRAASASAPPPTQPSTAPSQRASRLRRRAVGPTISAGRVARSISSQARSSRRRLTRRRRMSALNPPSLPSARRRWMPTLRSRSRPSVGRAHDPNPSPWSNSARTSHSSDLPASSRFPAVPGSLS